MSEENKMRHVVVDDVKYLHYEDVLKIVKEYGDHMDIYAEKVEALKKEILELRKQLETPSKIIMPNDPRMNTFEL